MGLFGFIKKQFIAVIEWTESENGILAYRFPMQDNEIQTGAQLTVRETQAALFVNEGEVADLFGPGRHQLTTSNLPILTALNNWDKAFNSPFKSDVYFFSTREQLDQKWGTAQPIIVKDKELGPIRIRAFGTYSYKISDPKTFFKKVSGTREAYTVEELEGQLRSAILTWLASFFGQSEVGFLDMAANQIKFSDTLKANIAPVLASYGLECTSFFVNSVSLPEEVQQHLDKASSMRMLGDLQKYAQFQVAESISTAAANPSGVAGAGAGLGAGMAIGQTMAGAFGGAGAAGASSGDVMKQIDQLFELTKKGVLTQAEFDAKKAELLKKIT